MKPNYAVVHYNRGLAYVLQGNPEIAIKDFKTATHLFLKPVIVKLKELGLEP